MSSTLQVRLKANFNVVAVFFILASIFSVFRIFVLVDEQTFTISELFINSRYIPILIQGFGLLALIVSMLTIKFADKLTEKQQVYLFCFLGMAFMPYTMIMYIIGIMIFINDNRHKIPFYIASILGMILFGVIIYIIFI